MPEVPPPAPTGDALLRILTALGNPHRMRIVAALVENRTYVSALAREIGISRPLLHMHLVTGTLEAADDGKTVKYYDVTPFVCELTPHTVARAAATLTDDGAGRSDRGAKEEAK
jgi:predicted transcriptional regulator